MDMHGICICICIGMGIGTDMGMGVGMGMGMDTDMDMDMDMDMDSMSMQSMDVHSMGKSATLTPHSNRLEDSTICSVADSHVRPTSLEEAKRRVPVPIALLVKPIASCVGRHEKVSRTRRAVVSALRTRGKIERSRSVA
jgi:hypothetical protein